MQRLITLLFFLIMGTGVAQSKYEQGMAKAFEFWENQKLDEASNLFERIATAEKEQWLPDYYVAQLYVLKCWNSWEDRNEVTLKANLDKAQEFINNIKTKAPNEPYAKLIQAQLYTVWVAHDGMKYGMKYSGIVGQIYNELQKQQPENPIFILNKAEWDVGAAGFFGTPIDQQCKAIERAIELFPTFSPETKFHPSFQINRAKEVAKQCK